MKVVVIGGGPGGYVAAIKAAMLGADVTIVEKKRVGGTCLNVGCIPTKALLACSDMLEGVREAKDYGVNVNGSIEADFQYMMKRKDKIVDQLVKGIEFLFDKKGAKLISGFGKLIDKNKVEVEKEDGSKEVIEADKIILATGSVPIVPPIFPYDGKKIITSDEALYLEEAPESLMILGGGVIGCEFGQFFSKIGTKVTIVEMADQLLPFEDKDVAKQLERSFKKDKIKMMTGQKIEKCEVQGDKVVAYLEGGKELEADAMLVSVGRKPYLDNLGLENVGINVERGKIVVNDKMETNVEGIYAIGDIVDTPFLAHVASKEGMVAAENALGKNKTVSYRAVPRCIYTSPEVAAVGITEKDADAKGIAYHVGKFDFRGLGKAQAMGHFQGFIKVLADAEDRIIGASIVGPHATDLLAELSLAVELGLTAEQVGDVIHPHPTLSEGIMEALHDVHKACVHSV
ncbi:dihydrolipoamide dehydrogenase LpdA [Clostridium aceticum]|uniref:Dihydrolipoyl dehydrogenase n=1 Tax=Clostridium aceticum TaxID=84022 RepID=A0A0D8IDT2_9CLOT|nr:dihydrolipoyl dehydrogenase [Clostridium aceticum]AKL94530.1 dihydrolipoamide dehydrogenase LpdA [Clostridium aceticum]KJF28264.1 pyridine nucleotide-disulfide oxidoreductase [Clostridium aceticum]